MHYPDATGGYLFKNQFVAVRMCFLSSDKFSLPPPVAMGTVTHSNVADVQSVPLAAFTYIYIYKKLGISNILAESSCNTLSHKTKISLSKI
jgi:hypothetical protein